MADSFGLKIGLEGEKEFKKALADINQSFKVLGSEMKLATSQFDKNDKSVEALAARNKVLRKEIDEQTTKIDTLRKALQNAATSFGENDRRTQNWQIQLNNAEAALNDMNRELDENEKAIKEGGKAAEESGSKFEGFGKVLKTVGVALGAVAVAAGAAAVKLGKEVIAAYADYEQLVGGVDTLFKDSSQEIQRYAANAYKTAGLSANEYMETVTGFSASLIQSLGGDTEKAAKYADMAITDMSDNANKMGTDMSSITKPLNGIVTIYGQHISYDLANVPVLPFSTESRSPQLILSQLLAGDTRFTGWTDYSDAKAFSVTQPKSVRACLGGTEGSMLSKWHGEFEWDNFTVKFHSHRGQKTGVVIEYGKNLTALEQDEDNSGVYTALLPYAVYTPEGADTETVVTLPEVTLPIVTSEIIRAKTLIMDFSDQFGSDTAVTEDALRAKANSYIKANPLGATIPTVKVSFEPLWKQPEYSALLERVNLCDTVTIRHSLLGVSVSAMVIETVYDTLAERYKSISLGQSKSSMITTISEVQSTVDKVESTVGRFPKLLQTAIGKATGLITGQSGGYVVIHASEENGQPYELLILDAPSIDEAVNVWRWNVGGLGFSHNGYNGPYETAITADGQIVADFITSGSLVANIIKAGVIQSQDGSSWWDLESGEVVLRAYATSKEVTEVSDRITTIEEQKMLRLVIISSNGNIFKNGNVKTLLSAKVYSWDEDITDTLDANQFIWTRVSDDAEADKLWNEQHFGGAKSVVITGADVKVRATFYCDLIDTTTRQSLL